MGTEMSLRVIEQVGGTCDRSGPMGGGGGGGGVVWVNRPLLAGFMGGSGVNKEEGCCGSVS